MVELVESLASFRHCADRIRAAATLGWMPHQSGDTAPVYLQLTEALEQLGRLGEIGGAIGPARVDR